MSRIGRWGKVATKWRTQLQRSNLFTILPPPDPVTHPHTINPTRCLGTKETSFAIHLRWKCCPHSLCRRRRCRCPGRKCILVVALDFFGAILVIFLFCYITCNLPAGEDVVQPSAFGSGELGVHFTPDRSTGVLVPKRKSFLPLNELWEKGLMVKSSELS